MKRATTIERRIMQHLTHDCYGGEGRPHLDAERRCVELSVVRCTLQAATLEGFAVTAGHSNGGLPAAARRGIARRMCPGGLPEEVRGEAWNVGDVVQAAGRAGLALARATR
jgi:hypothetical protein